MTFKENVPDLRNTRVIDIVAGLRARGITVEVHDPLADIAEAKTHYGLDLLASLEDARGYACVIGAVAHRDYASFGAETFARLLAPGGLVADIKGIWRGLKLPEGLRRWEL